MCPLILFTGKNVQKKNWRNKFQSHHNNKFRLLGCRCTFSKMKKRKASVEGKCFSFFLLNPIYLRGFISVVLWSQAKEYDHTRNALTQTRCNQQHVRSLSGCSTISLTVWMEITTRKHSCMFVAKSISYSHL